jgi:ABC-2 type transport system ATP-binding protein
VTIFFSTHILADVERVCDTVGILHEGRLVEVAGREELMSRYSTDVAELVVTAESTDALAAFTAELEVLPWVNGVTVEETLVRVAAADVVAGQLALLPLVVKHNLTLLRYEWVRPNLEEIFLSLSEEARP